jgi:uncharacterized protein (TIGR02099 family)
VLVSLVVSYSLGNLYQLWQLWLRLLLLLGLLILSILLAFHILPNYHSQIENLATKLLQQPIVIGDISTTWQHGMPILQLQHISLPNIAENLQFEAVKLKLHPTTDKIELSGKLNFVLAEFQANLEFIIYSSIHEFKSQQLKGKILLSIANLPNISSQFYAHNIADNWHIYLIQTYIHAQPLIALSPLYLSIMDDIIKLNMAELPLADIINLFLPMEINLSKGKLENLQLSYKSITNWQLNANLADISLNYQQHKLNNLSGTITAKPQQLLLQLNATSLDFIQPNLYSNSLHLQNLYGKLKLQHNQHNWQLLIDKFTFSEQQTPFILNGKVDFLADKMPYLDLKLKITNLAATSIHRYLPDQEIPEVVNWLQNSIIRGQVQQAELKLNGQADQVFALEQNKLYFTAKVLKLDLNYADKWIALEKINANIELAGNKLSIHPSEAYLLGSKFSSAKILLPNLSGKDKKLLITAILPTTAEKILYFIHNTPLSKRIDIEPEKLKIQGQVVLGLDLNLGLDGQADEFNGYIDFKNNQFQENFVGHQLQKLTGKLIFNNNGLVAKNLTAELWQQKVNLDFNLAQLADKLIISLIATGKLNKHFLHQQLQLVKPNWHSLAEYIEGSSNWQAELEIVNFAQNLDKNYTQLHLKSDLYGLDLHLPAPLHKISPLKLPLNLHLYFPSNQADQVSWQYGDLINGILSIDKTGIQTGQILLGSRARAKLPADNLLDIKGHISHLAVADWIKLFSALSSTDNEDDKLLPLDIQLNLQQLDLWKQIWTTVRTTIIHRDGLWLAFIDSAAAAGKIRYNSNNKILNAELKHLYLQAPNGNKNLNLDPNSKFTDPAILPEISAHIDKLHFADKFLGKVNFYTKNHHKGLELEHFEAKADGLSLQAKGLWEYNDNRAHSWLEIDLFSLNSSLFAQHLGYNNSPIINALVEANLEINWPGGFDDFAIDVMRGHLQLLMRNGSIVDVEPGVGRVFGLFNMFTIPKRLILDFRDITDVGLHFDSIIGQFDILDGKIIAKQAILNSNIAYVEIQGYTDFVHEYYAQQIKVIPQLSPSLPMASALVGGLGVGAIALIIQQLIQSKLEETIFYQYQVIGNWQQPIITELD